ncbi:MAG: STAS domain-containing protein [Ilumatobacteraceae bacterium]
MRTRDMRRDHAIHPLDGFEHLPFSLSVSRRSGHRVVRIGGELDMVTRSRVRRACVDGLDNVVEVEMEEMSFMDCCGYGALVAARLALQERGGSLTLRHQVGQPAELLAMLRLLELGS